MINRDVFVNSIENLSIVLLLMILVFVIMYVCMYVNVTCVCVRWLVY